MPKRDIILTTDEAVKGLSENKLWVCSHGGVGSEYLTAQLGITYKKTPLLSTYEFNQVIVHYPKPVPAGPKKAIFLYGDLYNSIYSQIKRHPYNPQKFANNNFYPLINSMKDLFKISKKTKDPYKIFNMFQNFMTAPITYPLLLMKYNPPDDVIKRMKTFTNKEFEYKFKPRSSDFLKDHGPEKINKMKNIYGDLAWIMDEMPHLIIRFPISTDFKLTDDNVIFQSKSVSDNNTLSPTNVPHTAVQNRFTFNNNEYVVYQSFEDVILLLHNVTKNKTVELKASNGLITNARGFSVCKFMRQIYIILNFKPLIAVKVINLETGACIFCTKKRKLPEQTDIICATPMQMWNHPNYVGFYKTPEYTVKSFVFNPIKEKVHIKDVDFKLLSNNTEEESFVSLKVDGLNITATTHAYETVCQYKIIFDAFCKHFNVFG